MKLIHVIALLLSVSKILAAGTQELKEIALLKAMVGRYGMKEEDLTSFATLLIKNRLFFQKNGFKALVSNEDQRGKTHEDSKKESHPGNSHQ